MRGFGEAEQKRSDAVVYQEPVEETDVQRLEQLAKDILMATDRNQDQKINFSE
jgi:hypothetical protein